MVLKFTFRGYPSIAFQIPATFDNFHNLSHITTVNICLGLGYKAIWLNGPSGELYTRGECNIVDGTHFTGTAELPRFLSRFDTSRCRRLEIAQYNSIQDPPTLTVDSSAYRLLRSMSDLRTLTLIEPNNLPFILALDPDENPDKIVLCPKLEGITLYTDHLWKFHVNELLSMAEERASRDAKLSTITILSMDTLAPPMEVLELGKHVSRVECKVENTQPTRDTLTGHDRAKDNSQGGRV